MKVRDKIFRVFAATFLVATISLHQINRKYFHIPYAVFSDTIAAIADPSVPKFYLPPFYCAGYALIAAEIIGKGGYNFSDAWDLAKKNRVLWEGKAKSLDELNIEPPLGSIIGFYNSRSNYNQEGRDFTHVALYIGNGYIIHQYGPLILKSKLDHFLKTTGVEMRVIIVPLKEGAYNHILSHSILLGFYDIDYK
ncbi:MAG: hypothetical protein QXJ06_03015 [Candidatus Aenigmatarchaeota archaeon]